LAHETIPRRDETIFRFWRRRPETADGYQPQTGDSQMRTLSFILAFGFVLAGPSMAGLSDGGLPGVGSFAYSGSPIAASAPIVVAAR
jgi:hypothetical protein